MARFIDGGTAPITFLIYVCSILHAAMAGMASRSGKKRAGESGTVDMKLKYEEDTRDDLIVHSFHVIRAKYSLNWFAHEWRKREIGESRLLHYHCREQEGERKVESGK